MAPTRRRFSDLALTALAAIPYALAYATVSLRAAWRWTKAAWGLGAERAGKRWPHAG